MLRRFTCILILLAVVALPAAALRHHPRTMPTAVNNSTSTKPHISIPEAPTWLIPALNLVTSLLFLFGAVPGIIAYNKDMPNKNRILIFGIIFGYLFFPITFVLLYRALKYEKPPVKDQASFRPANVVQMVSQTHDVTIR
jgi:hypothetical protein